MGLPIRPFLYTIDQLCTLLNLSQRKMAEDYIFFEGRSVGARRKEYMTAVNIAPPESTPEWRIAEREFIRWLKYKGFRVYETGAVSN